MNQRTVRPLKTGIHPEYYPDAVVTCACGAEAGRMVTGGTKQQIRVEVCSHCHPFWTGEQRIVDTEGRVERLMRRYGMSPESAGVATSSETGN